MKITENEIKRISSPTIYKRGMEYFKQGRVHLKSRNPERITAAVDGSEVYNVCINFDGDKVTDTLCTCPYYHTMGSTCKHIVAVLKTRQAEIEENGVFENENDMLAAGFCAEFEQREKQEYRIALVMRISPAPERIFYSVAVTLVLGEERYFVQSAERFFSCIADGKPYKIAKNHEFSAKDSCFEPVSEEIAKILSEACENKRSENGVYVPHASELDFGAGTAKRLFPLLGRTECEYVIDAVSYRDTRTIDDDPDILVDITADGRNINLSVSESGIALTPDGSWFFFEDAIYKTSREWQSWFMPIYRAVIKERRTQLEFSGDNCVKFAARVLPRLRHCRGVVCYGVDELVVLEKPEFEIYFDRIGKKITAVAKACYGGVSITLPCAVYASDKVIVRDRGAEDEIVSFFKDFDGDGAAFSIDDDEMIFRFVKNSLPKLFELAKIYTSDSFDALTGGELPEVSAAVEYDKKIDLLELTVDSELSEKEISAIFNAYYTNKSYYRFADGRYLDLGQKGAELDFLANLLPEGEEIKGMHRIPKFYSLYIAGQKGKISAGDEFLSMVSNALESHAQLPDYLDKVLRDYQKTGVHWMHQLSRLGLGGILADDMGLGKTLQVIAFVMSENPKVPALVVAPSSLVYNWMEEIRRFAPDAKAMIADGPKEERERILGEMDNCDFVITSYALLRRDTELYKNCEFSYCFADEAQYIKNANTMNASAVKSIKAGGCFALTGTPIENSISELWSIFDFVLPGYLGTQKDFLKKYENDSGLPGLRKKIKPFVLRRMKKDVLSELPEKIENTLFADFEDEQKQIYSAFLKAARREVDAITASGEGTIRILSLLTRLRQICCHPALINPDYKKDSGKLALLNDLVLSAIGSGHRILIFSQFTSMLAIIKKKLDSEKIDSFYLDGSTPTDMRVDMARRFNGGEKEVFLISLKAGGTGLNLTGADMVIHYDPWWNPAVMDQASDRAYRIGQKRAVQVIKLAAHNSIEEQILKLAEKKRGLADGVIKENKSLLSSLSREELLKLFE